MQSYAPLKLASAEECVDQIIQRVGDRIVLGLPLGLGKPCQIANALYRRAKADPQIHLTILSALHIERPASHNDLEKRFLDPILDRIFGDYPGFDYLPDVRSDCLPPNVEVAEFFLAPGKFLRNPVEQQNYISSNYTHAARDLVELGANVVAQLVCEKEVDGKRYYSLSCNPDLTLHMLALLRERERQGQKIAIVAQVHNGLPFMYHDAMVEPSAFDMVVQNRAYEFTLPAPPNVPVSITDHMIGLLASTLIKDGGTLQIGIGSLGDAIVNGILLRHRENPVYRDVLANLGITEKCGGLIAGTGGTAPFAQGLYGASEMFVSGFLELYRAGILTREVYPDVKLQRLVNRGAVTTDVTKETLDALLDSGSIQPVLTRKDFDWLQTSGVFRQGITFTGGEITAAPGLRIAADLSDPENFHLIVRHCLGERLRGGVVMHGGFFLGPRSFYDALNAMGDEERMKFGMTSVMFVNQLYGHQELATLQRAHARFLNTTMMVTLNGGACSDGLENGQMVSGVGGQYNFVAMAHELPGARSILTLRSTRTKGGKVTSNIVPNYGALTIPRHLRDIVVTEYGIADLRGRSDKDVIAALLNIADSRFQDELMRKAINVGKLPRDHQIPDAFRNNYPERIESDVLELRRSGYFPTFPFGTDLTNEELVLAKTLKALKGRMSKRGGVLGAIAQAIEPHSVSDQANRYLARLQLLEPRTLQERMLRRLIVAELSAQEQV
jgi:acyl-CoA hydrolase